MRPNLSPPGSGHSVHLTVTKRAKISRGLPAICSAEQYSSFSSWSWLRCFLKIVFTFNLNFPESLKQRCTVITSDTLHYITSDTSASRPSTQSYASRAWKKSLGKKFKIKRFASSFGEIWDSRSIEGKEKLSTDSLTVILSTVNFCLADTSL